jgi:type IV pilus assembly protein PilB
MDARLLTPQALEEVLESQKTDSRRLGTLLVEKGLINETQLTQILSHQLSVPWVSLLHVEFSRQLLNLVPHKVAERYCLVPIYVRHVRGQGETLYVAMEDPSNEDALRECMNSSGLPVRAMIAPPSDIRAAIRAYYGVVPSRPPGPMAAASHEASAASPDLIDTLPQPVSLLEPPDDERVTVLELAPAGAPAQEAEQAADATPAEALAPAVNDASEPGPAPAEGGEPLIAEPVAGEAAPALDLPAPSSSEPAADPAPAVELAPAQGQRFASDAPTIEAVEVEIQSPRRPPISAADTEAVPPSEMPRSSKRRGPPMVSLTLLDGTTITLPARPKSSPDLAPEPFVAPATSPESNLTARDLVAALRAVSHGADASEAVGNMRWEAMFAALLSVLLRKHLIADWEFVEELKKI